MRTIPSLLQIAKNSNFIVSHVILAFIGHILAKFCAFLCWTMLEEMYQQLGHHSILYCMITRRQFTSRSYTTSLMCIENKYL